jgi:hypothetical protein
MLVQIGWSMIIDCMPVQENRVLHGYSANGADLRARRMAAHAEEIENAIYFLTDVANYMDGHSEASECPSGFRRLRNIGSP